MRTARGTGWCLWWLPGEGGGRGPTARGCAWRREEDSCFGFGFAFVRLFCVSLSRCLPTSGAFVRLSLSSVCLVFGSPCLPTSGRCFAFIRPLFCPRRAVVFVLCHRIRLGNSCSVRRWSGPSGPSSGLERWLDLGFWLGFAPGLSIAQTPYL
jgi:hypothetical protein